MAADASIYSLIRQPQAPPNPIEQYGQTLQLKNLMGQQKIQEQAIADDEATRQAYQQAGGDPSKLKDLLYGKGLYKPAMEAGKYAKEITKSDSDLMKNDGELMAKFNSLSKDEYPTLTPENYPAYKELSFKRAGMFSTPQMREAGLRAVQQMPDKFNSPEEFYNYISQKMVKANDMGEIIASGALPGTKEFADAWKKKAEGGQGRGEYSVPVQTASHGILAFDTRTKKFYDASGNQVTGKVVGAQFDPALQGRLTGAKKFGEEVGKETADVGRGTDALTSINDARVMLNKGIYTGFYADINKTIAKATPGANKEKAANTEEYLSHIGNIVIPRLKEFGGNDTVEEMKYLQDVMAGKVTLEEKAIRGILDSAERKLKAKMKRLGKQAETVGLGEQAAIGAPIGVNPGDLSDDEIRRELGL